MKKITVFNTYEQAERILEEYLEYNDLVGEKIVQIGEEKQKGRYLMLSNPSSVGFPRDELWSDIGKGLELICAIDLNFVEGHYYLDGGIFFKDLSGHVTIRDLVNSVKKCIVEENTNYNGATLKPFFYTVLEHSKVTKETMENFRLNFLRLLQGVENEDGIIPEINDEQAQADIMSLKFSDSQGRALNEEERAEFERLFYHKE